MAQLPNVVLVVVVALVAVIAGFAAGYLLRGAPPANATVAAAENSTLSITAAGTLGTLFPQLATLLAQETPGLQAPLSAQIYQGSLAALGLISASHEKFDVAAAADYRLIPQLLENGSASWEIVFGTTPEVLAYDPNSSAFNGVNSTNWVQALQAPGVTLGVANASIDPNGYNGIFVLELAGWLDYGNKSTVYSHFYTTPVGSLAVPDSATTHLAPESTMATLLATNVISATIIYRTYAVQHHLSFVTLPDAVSLGDVSAGAIANDSLATTTIAGSSGPVLVTGAPVAFAATVPATAPNATAGLLFVHLLLAPAGIALLEAGGFTAVSPGWVDRPSALPPLLQPMVVPLPAGLANLLPPA